MPSRSDGLMIAVNMAEFHMIQLGYCCINLTLQETLGIGTNRTMRKKTFQEKGLSHVSKLSLQNTEDLIKLIEWNNENGIKVFRMSSEMFPWASEYDWTHLPDFKVIQDNLQKAGTAAARGGQRLSFHPGPFNCLTSGNPNIVKNCVRDLQIHADIMDMMGQPRDHRAKINIHLGGSYGDRETAARIWCENYENLPESIKSRLTVENDDRQNLYSTKMLYDLVHHRVGVPIVFDTHHFECGPQDSTYEEAFEMACATWPTGIRPVFHHSNSKKEYEDPTALVNAHSDYYYKPFISLGRDVDVSLECKSKELGLFDYLKKFGLQH